MPIVYNHKRNDTGEVFYVGIGKHEKRAYIKHNRTTYWHNVVNAVGYTVDITHRNIIWEEACSIENYLIAFYGRKDLGLGTLINLTDGGEGAVNPPEEIRRRRGELQKGKFVSNETREKLRKAQTGKKYSDELRKKLSDIHRGEKHTRERVLNQVAARSWYKHPDNIKNKISAAHSGENQKKLECPFCLLIGKASNMKRWHFENCKHKTIAA
jgi:hypothetical protein